MKISKRQLNRLVLHYYKALRLLDIDPGHPGIKLHLRNKVELSEIEAVGTFHAAKRLLEKNGVLLKETK